MNKIKQILIGASLVALSGNAAAMMIDIEGKEYSYDVKGLLPVIQRIVNEQEEVNITDNQLHKLRVLHQKYDNTAKRLARGGDDISKKKQIKQIKNHSWRSLKVKMGTLDFAGVSNLEILIADAGEAGGGGEAGGEGKGGYDGCEGQGDCGHSIPEPSTIALLGLGLVGIGAARRLRKKAH